MKKQHPKIIKRHQVIGAVALERRIRAWQMRKAGASTRTIGKELGVSHTAVEKMLKKTIMELRAIELEASKEAQYIDLARIDDLILRLQPILGSKEERNQLSAVEKFAKLLELRGRIYGYNAPTKVAPTTPDGEAQYEPGEKLTDEQALERAQRVIDVQRLKFKRRDAEGPEPEIPVAPSGGAPA